MSGTGRLATGRSIEAFGSINGTGVSLQFFPIDQSSRTSCRARSDR